MPNKLVTDANFEYILEIVVKFVLTNQIPLIRVVEGTQPCLIYVLSFSFFQQPSQVFKEFDTIERAKGILLWFYYD